MKEDEDKSPDTPPFQIRNDPEAWLLRDLPHAVMDWMREFTGLETQGIENVPRHGPCILIPNHSGALGWDVFVLQNEILKEVRRVPRTMSHAFWHRHELLEYFASRLAFIPPDFRAALRILRRNNLLIIFPEAEAGNFKASRYMYQLQDFNPGFIPLAVMAGASIVPVCILGAEETHLNAGTTDWARDFFGSVLPIPINLLPLPVQWKMVFLEPIRMDMLERKDLKDEKLLQETANAVRYRLQKAINAELKSRGYFRFKTK